MKNRLDDFIVIGEIGTCVIETCVECGEKFLRGIFPQRTCDRCSCNNTKIYQMEENKEQPK